MLSHMKRLNVVAAASIVLLCTALTSASPPKASLASADRDTGIIHLDTSSYNQFITHGAEDYRSDHAVILLLTANRTPGVDCGPCRLFQPGYDEVAKAWRKKAKAWTEGKAGVYFAQVEFKDGREIFQQLELNYAPVIIFVPKGAPVSKGLKFQFERHGFSTDAFANWAGELMGTSTGYRKPFPWKSALTFSAAALVTTVGGLFALAKLNTVFASGGGGSKSLGNFVLNVLIQSVSLGLIVVCCAGYMWNVIRGSPFVQVQGNGKIEYFSRQFQHQLAVETLIVAGIYSVLAFSVVALILWVPRQRDPTKQRAGVYVWSVILLAGISVLFAVFRIKK